MLSWLYTGQAEPGYTEKSTAIHQQLLPPAKDGALLNPQPCTTVPRFPGGIQPSTLLQKPLESLSPGNPETTVEPGITATLQEGKKESTSKEEQEDLEAASRSSAALQVSVIQSICPSLAGKAHSKCSPCHTWKGELSPASTADFSKTPPSFLLHRLRIQKQT